jgi:hypothetical protein
MKVDAMRVRHGLLILGSLVLPAVLASAGCSNYYEQYYLSLVGVSGSDGGDGGDSGPPPSCIPAKNSDAIDGSCGVFVSGDKGSDTKGKGTKDAPYKTIGAALKAGSVVYACASATGYVEAVTFGKRVSLFGGLDCGTWSYDAAKPTKLTAGVDQIPLVLESAAGGSDVEDFEITAKDASKHGGSSIAVLVDGAAASFERTTMTAGAAKDGVAGVNGGPQEAQAESGKKGDDAGTSGSQNGGDGGSNAVCSLSGGKGGSGGGIANGPGADGLPGDNGNGGTNGTGENTNGCTPGGQGANGTTPSFGAAATGPGTLDSSGYHGANGGDGADGTAGKSGGGGGGSKATTNEHGAGGGGGGAGGCGGKLGTGGTAGGSSIALVTIGAALKLTSCALHAGQAGNGGNGGDGQKGQPGGDPGAGGKASGPASGCYGGSGGKGGNGGNGGGGLGGHSLGIAATGSALVIDAATTAAISNAPTAGTGGDGGNANENSNAGAGGQATACWDFGSNAACSMADQ